MEIKQGDLIKLWTWCGFKIGDYPEPKVEPNEKAWYDPQGMFYGGIFDPPQFTLDNIFRYTIPKLQDKGYSVELLAFEHRGFRVIIRDEIHLSPFITAKEETADNPAEALYKAIMKVINKETNETN